MEPSGQEDSNLREKVKHGAMTDEEIGNTLISTIVDLYVTIRGFTFAKSFEELYKQEVNTQVQSTEKLLATQDYIYINKN